MGCIFGFSSTASFITCTFASNIAYTGVMCICQIRECVVHNMHIRVKPSFYWWQVYLSDSSNASFITCKFVSNKAGYGGSVCLLDSSNASFITCTF